MRVYNNTTSSLSLPLESGAQFEINAKSVSGEILGSNKFLTTVISNFTTDEIAFIVNGPWELTLCANIPTCTNYVVQTLEEAVERFAPKEEVKPEIKIENKNENEVEPVCESENCNCESCSCEKEQPKKRRGRKPSSKKNTEE